MRLFFCFSVSERAKLYQKPACATLQPNPKRRWSCHGEHPERFVRRSNKEFTQFLFIAMPWAAEVQSHLYIGADQRYLSKDAFETIYNQADKTARIISGLIK